MKNNKGVTLVELLVVIVVMGIIAGFAIPAVGNIIENANKDALLNDAIQVENAAKLYCSSNTCDSEQALTWGQLKGFVDGIDDGIYNENDADTDVIAYRAASGTGWGVKLTTAAANDWQFPSVTGSVVNKTVSVPDAISEGTGENWMIPNSVTRDQISTADSIASFS